MKSYCIGDACLHCCNIDSCENYLCGLDEIWRAKSEECPHDVPDLLKKELHVPASADMVNQPPHYTQGGVECIDAIQAAVTGKPPYEAWLVGQIIKYLWRYNFKNGAEDVKKAEFYLKRLVDTVENPQ